MCGVGIMNGKVADADLTASSCYDDRYLPQQARLGKDGTSSSGNGWLRSGENVLSHLLSTKIQLFLRRVVNGPKQSNF